MYLWIRLISIVLIFSFLIMGCQRFEPPQEQSGLDKDSHSYTYMGYPDQKIKQAVEGLRGVKEVTTEYNGKKIIMHVYLDASIPQNQLQRFQQRIRHRVNQAAPINPVHIIIHSPHQIKHS